MNASTVTVILSQKPIAAQMEHAIASLVENLGVKPKTAQQIINNIPLRVYNELSLAEGRILVEALNVITNLDWEIQDEKNVNIPSVNWNKTPMIRGLSLSELVAKNDPIKTGVGKLIPALQIASPVSKIKNIKENNTPVFPVLDNQPALGLVAEAQDSGVIDSTILKTADSVVRHLSQDLAEAYRKNTLSPNPIETQSSPGYLQDSQNIPGSMKSRMEPGFYNLYLPAINNKDARQKVSKMCQDALNWSAADTMQNLSKPIICIARNVDDIDAMRLMDRFAQIEITLNCKLRSKI